MDEKEKSKVESLNEALYSRTRYKNPQDLRSSVREIEPPEVEEEWQGPSLGELLTHERKVPEVKPFMRKFFVFAVLFFIATILVAGIVFLGGVNFISSKNVDISVVGPTIASAGEVLDLSVTVANKNNSNLDPAFFSIQYPSGSRDPLNSSKSLTYSKIDMGEIKAGDEIVNNVRTVLIGSVGEVKEFKFSVEYKVKGSNATFYKDKVYQVTIGDAPLSLTIEAPPRVNSGDSFTIKLAVTLNSTEILRDVMLRAEYPYGFSVITTVPEAVAENNVWSLGDLAPGATKNIEIHGRLVGENQDERTFRFYVGVSDSSSISPNFKTVILSAQETVAIERPSIALNIGFNSETVPVYIAPAGRLISTTVRFQNNLPERLLNPRLEVRFSGNALNKSSVLVQNTGSYNANSNRITWALLNSQALPELVPGESGSVSFSFSSIPETALAAMPREIGMQFIITGTLAGESRPLSVTESRTVKIASQVTFNSRAVYSIGQFDNKGPIPPKVGTETTYSILWSVGNTQSDLNDAKVTAKLGTGVKWIGGQEDTTENISYDEANNTVTWNLGDLPSGVGFLQPERTVAFQVSITPIQAQIGIAPTLVTNIVFSGRDATTGENLTITKTSLTTRLSSDPAFIQGDDVVQK